MKTQEELDQLKESLSAIHKPLYTITVPLDEDETETATIFLKKFDRTTLAAVQKVAVGGDSLKATEIFLKATFLGGDDLSLVLGNLDALRACESVVIELITAKKAKLAKN